MSDLVIRSGSAVEVDTASLRAVAVELRGIGGEAHDVAADANAAAALVAEVGADALLAHTEIFLVAAAITRAADDAYDLSEAVDRAAELYDTVELLVARDLAQATGDTAAARRLSRALADVPVSTIDAAERAIARGGDGGELERQAFLGGLVHGSSITALLPLLVGGARVVVDAVGRGRVAAGSTLAGPATPVRVRPVATAAAAAPASLAAAAARIPGGGEARVRVERYAMPSGRTEYAVYLAGTQSGAGDDEAFDMASNISLYAGERSASYDAALAALDAAGAQPGDVVHAFGHSQGAMVGERLALEGPYDTRTLASFGSPVQVDAGDTTLAVSVQHSDDPIVALQDGGHAAGVGAPGSFVAERVADPLPGARDLGMPAHQLTAYVETAGLVDASTDPRVDAVRDVFERLGGAESVIVTDYAAERVSPSRGDAG